MDKHTSHTPHTFLNHNETAEEPDKYSRFFLKVTDNSMFCWEALEVTDTSSILITTDISHLFLLQVIPFNSTFSSEAYFRNHFAPIREHACTVSGDVLKYRGDIDIVRFVDNV